MAIFSLDASFFFFFGKNFLYYCIFSVVLCWAGGQCIGGKGGVEEGGVVLCLGMKGYDGGDMGSKSGGWVYR